eukprot:7062160-Prymnesium_polylepis.2
MCTARRCAQQRLRDPANRAHSHTRTPPRALYSRLHVTSEPLPRDWCAVGALTSHLPCSRPPAQPVREGVAHKFLLGRFYPIVEVRQVRAPHPSRDRGTAARTTAKCVPPARTRSADYRPASRPLPTPQRRAWRARHRRRHCAAGGVRTSFLRRVATP